MRTAATTKLPLTVFIGSLAFAMAAASCTQEGEPTQGYGHSSAAITALDSQQLLQQISAPTTTVPPECAAPNRLQIAYLSGAAQGTRLVTKAWKKYGSCDQVEAFADSVVAYFDSIEDQVAEDRPAKRCRYAGKADAAFARLDSIQQYCANRCFMNGTFVGKIEAMTYCDLIIDAAGNLDPQPWIREPVAICGFTFELACDAQFLGSTQSYTNETGACQPYTVNPYFTIWDRSRLKSCDYYNHDNSTQ